MATKKPYLILYSRSTPVSKSVAPSSAKKPKGSGSAFESDIAKAVKLLRKGGDGGMPMALPAAPPGIHAPRRAPIATPRVAPPAAVPQMAPPAPTPKDAHLATGPNATAAFTHEEMSLPSDKHSAQLHNDPSKLMEDAARHKTHLDNLIDRGEGVGSKLGFHVVEGRVPTPEDYEQAHQKGGMVMLAPLKGEKRMRQKAEDNYGGDYSRMKDLSRASIAVSHPDDIPHVVHHLRQHGMTLGSKPNDRFNTPTEAGYSDIQTEVTDPHGHRGELQIHSLDHLQAKEQGFPGVVGGHSGHHMYEELRDMKGKEPTPELNKRKEELNAASQELYGEANRRIASRTPRFAHLPIEKSVGGTGGTGRFRIGVSVHHVPGTNKAKGTHSMSEHQNTNTTQQALQPGYFDWNGIPAHREKYAATPKFFNGAEWKHVDEGKFAHEAKRIPEHEFEEMVALRKHQHEKHVAATK